MKVCSLKPTLSGRVFFRRVSGLFLPANSGCYVLATFDDSILYVGLTRNLKRRFKNHLDVEQKVSPTIVGKAFWFHYLPCEEKHLELFERSWLEQYRNVEGKFPVFNKVSSPVS
ncbi:GIY-YIG nuclease family protein [Cupriavidus alkaliphilus]|uniref:GIY-YIG nuclease family protein n=1 Tax=Cupriavidus alkaliphilus TaxID=942866 RepID=UPI0035D4B980